MRMRDAVSREVCFFLMFSYEKDLRAILKEEASIRPLLHAPILLLAFKIHYSFNIFFLLSTNYMWGTGIDAKILKNQTDKSPLLKDIELPPLDS